MANNIRGIHAAEASPPITHQYPWGEECPQKENAPPIAQTSIKKFELLWRGRPWRWYIGIALKNSASCWFYRIRSSHGEPVQAKHILGSVAEQQKTIKHAQEMPGAYHCRGFVSHVSHHGLCPMLFIMGSLRVQTPTRG